MQALATIRKKGSCIQILTTKCNCILVLLDQVALLARRQTVQFDCQSEDSILQALSLPLPPAKERPSGISFVSQSLQCSTACLAKCFLHLFATFSCSLSYQNLTMLAYFNIFLFFAFEFDIQKSKMLLQISYFKSQGNTSS